MYDPLAHQIGFAFLTSYGMELLKRTQWFPWVSQHSALLNRWISMLSAALTSIGVTFAADLSWTAGGTITIHLPALTVLLEAITRFAGQAGMQELIYARMIQPKAIVEAGGVPGTEAMSAASKDTALVAGVLHGQK